MKINERFRINVPASTLEHNSNLAHQGDNPISHESRSDVTIRVSRCRQFLMAAVRVPVTLHGVEYAVIRRLLRRLNHASSGMWFFDADSGNLVLRGRVCLAGGRGKLGKAAARLVVALVGEAAGAMPLVATMAPVFHGAN